MDIGTLLLMLAIATLTIAYILQPLFTKAKPQRDELIDHWLRQASAAGSAETENKVCPQCGQLVHAGDRFCAACGTKLEELEEEED